jgi:hypothetical protein
VTRHSSARTSRAVAESSTYDEFWNLLTGTTGSALAPSGFAGGLFDPATPLTRPSAPRRKRGEGPRTYKNYGGPGTVGGGFAAS